jgi:hypothetical protein
MKTVIRDYAESGNERQTFIQHIQVADLTYMSSERGLGQGPTCTEGTDIFIHLEADNSTVVINDVCLSIPGTCYHLLMPIALKKVREKDARRVRSCFRKRSTWALWCMPVFPALRRLKQEDCKFKASLDYTLRSKPGWAI